VSVDLGTGDGRLPYVRARQTRDRLFVGLDANAAGLRDLSTRAERAGLTNLIYVRASIEEPPPELAGVADEVTAILPWGSLLATFAQPVVPLLKNVRRLCAPGAILTVVLGVDPERDHAEVLRLGLPVLDEGHLAVPLAAGYADAGFTVTAVRALTSDDLALWASSWAKRLAFSRPRPMFQIEART
jgi:16S rRNA (adenine(1408)-N(1))-methyltransferase